MSKRNHHSNRANHDRRDNPKFQSNHQAKGSRPQSSGAASNNGQQRRHESSSALSQMGERLQEGKKAVVNGASELTDSIKEEVASDFEAAKKVVRGASAKVEEIVEEAQEAIVEAGSSLLKSVKSNPVPAALAGAGIICVGVGVTWMIMSTRDSAGNGESPKTSGDGAGKGERKKGGQSSPKPIEDGQHMMEKMTDGASRLAHRAQSTISDATQAAGKSLGRAVQGVRTQGRRVGTFAQKNMRENPLAAGAAMAAVGAAVGLALPITEQEDKWLGQERDEIVDKAEELARGAIDKVESAIST